MTPTSIDAVSAGFVSAQLTQRRVCDVLVRLPKATPILLPAPRTWAERIILLFTEHGAIGTTLGRDR